MGFKRVAVVKFLAASLVAGIVGTIAQKFFGLSDRQTMWVIAATLLIPVLWVTRFNSK